MNRLSKRLKILASFISKEDSVVDVGCDHGYLGIYLKQQDLCKSIVCSDINQNALNCAIRNVEDSGLNIECVLSDGIKSISMNNINTIIISGMGTATIKGILGDREKLIKVDKIILQSNNNHEELRRFMNDIGYYLDKEKYIIDKGKWYVTMLFIKSNKKNQDVEFKYGYLDKNYGNYLLENYNRIRNRIPEDNLEYQRIGIIIKEIETIMQ